MEQQAVHNVVGVVGWSGSGKTQLLEYLVQRLVARGLRINVIKHSHHDIVLEPPHKDSARLRMAGASQVMIASPYRVAVIEELRGAAEPTLGQQLAAMQPADLTLVEGYKWESIPKLEVYRPVLGQPSLYATDEHIVAVASDQPRPSTVRDDLAWLDLNQPEQVLTWLSQTFFPLDPQEKAKPTVNKGLALL